MEKFKSLTSKEKRTHLLLYIIGIVFMPLGVVLTINAHLGAGGYDALNFALGETLDINTSLAIYMTAIIAVVVAAIVRKGLPRITTFISSFFLGIFTDLWKQLLVNLEGNTFFISLILFIIGMLIIAFAVAAYIISVLPSNPTDDLVVALSEKGMNLGMAKIGLDVLCVIVAIIMGGEIGIGTIICTFGLGPFINVFHKFILKIINNNNLAKAV
ncbi:MAG: membrane protein [Clostridium sp.]|nr:membrane protein [Clostridium sp.]MDU7083026.1 membrane protein [Clostridium sp.]